MRLISVRFGNVLASNGSVVPKFKAQIEAGGPVTVTHPDMVRYFMTIREACDLVITAATHALGTQRPDVSVYVLNMGQPVKIVDLAERMISLSGLQPGYDIEIVFTGMRPGERLHEILFASEEPTREIGRTPYGMRRRIPIIGGTFEGPRIRGRVLPGGADWQLQRADFIETACACGANQQAACGIGFRLGFIFHKAAVCRDV